MSNKEMLINVSEGEECRIALLEDGKLEELYMERASSTSHVGNIYKGRVTNVEASIQAAFVDFGLGRNGFLHISDLMPTYFGRKGEDIQESVGRKMARRDRPPIQRCLRRGDEIIVQIIKEGIGTKGPTLSTYLSIPGRILVMMPGMGKFGVSRKIEDEDERRRLRTILDSLKPLKDVGFIIRTAGIGKTKTDIQRDLTYLTRLWQTIEKKRKSGAGPMELYTEGDLVTRTVRDVFSTDIDRIVVDNKDVAKRVKDVIKLANPRTKNKVEFYEETMPLFSKYGIEREIELMYSRHVPLPSGGSLVIDSTEAIVAIDVNSGKFREHADAETTAFKTDMEAADEIPRQLRLRDLGGVIICDFIDLRYERHRRDLEKRLHDNLRNDRAKTKVLRMSQFGIIEMTRQRMRPSLKRSIYFDCPHCKGSGLVKTPESMSLDVMRRLAIAIADARVQRVELTVCPDVAFYLLNKKRVQLADMESKAKKRVMVREDPKLALDDLQLELYDTRDGLVYLPELGMSPFGQGEDARRRHQHPQGGGRRDGRGRQGGAQHQRGRGHEPSRRNDRGGRDRGREREPDRDEERFELVEDVVDRREEQREEDEETAVVTDSQAEELATEPGTQVEESGVVEVDEPSEPMGEGPRAFEEAGGSDEHGGSGQRRRRRRGRRGRGGGRGREQQPARANAEDENLPDVGEGPVNEPQDAEVGTEAPAESGETNQAAGEGPRRRRRRRGGRRHRRRRGNAEAAGAPAEPASNGDVTQAEPSPADDEEQDDSIGNRRDSEDQDDRDRSRRPPPQRTTPQRTPPPRSAAPPSPPVPRTGSTDRHLMHEDAVDTTQPVEPPRRPRHYRDLDAIPDDFEDR